MNKALILVDFENEWIDENSNYYVGDISKELENTNKLIKYCRNNDYKIIFVRHIEKDSKDEFKENSFNTEIISSLDKFENDILISKYKISPFYKTRLEKELENIDKLVICGLLANLCVRSIIQDAYDRDFEITVIKDCIVAFSEEIKEFTFNDLKETREEIEFVNLNEFIN